MTPDNQKKIFDAGFKSGNEHNSPSEITKEFMKEQKTINNNVLTLVTKIDKTVAIMANDVIGIHEQTKKTNGRVTKNTKWRQMITGGLIAMNALYLPIAFYVIFKFIEQVW